MAKKPKAEETKDRFVETLIVGAGPAGLSAARRLQKAHPEMQILVLEAADRSGGKAQSGLHLVNSSSSEAFELLVGEELKPALIRWEKSWLPHSEVKWQGEDWIGELPQWKLYLEGTKKLFFGIPESDIDVPVKTLSPISRLSEITESTEYRWKLESPENTYLCKRVIWAAGLTAFQNAYGKHEAQAFLTANPLFDAKAQDFRGGVAFEIGFVEKATLNEEIPHGTVLGIPLRHNGKRHLILAAFVNDQLLKTLTHVHLDLLTDPKEVLSFQKSLRRAVHSLFTAVDETKISESWVVSTRVGGHSLGSPWVLDAAPEGAIEFVGEESIAATKSGLVDTLAALDSISLVSGINDLPLMTTETTEQREAEVLQ